MALNTEEFIRRAKLVHGDEFDYSKSKYTLNSSKIDIRCRVHGKFSPIASDHLRGTGCKKCHDDSMKDTAEKFVEKARSVHGNKYDYSNLSYKSSRNRVSVICSVHGKFSITASVHLSGRGCARCESQFNTDSFVAKAVKVHGKLYDYSESMYLGATEKITIRCSTHGKFSQTVSNHLQGAKCPKCSSVRGHSKIAIRWIEEEAKSRRMRNVMHAGNGGEFRLPGTKIRVDGYHPSTKTVFEFHGDAFHGNPKRYTPRSKPNPFSDRTAASLYKETLLREQRIRDLGYRLVVVWESEYRLTKL